MSEPGSQTRAFSDPTLERFLKKRGHLHEGLEESRLAIDEWLAHHMMPTTLTSLARLEALLARQRDLHAEMATLEDNFMHYLLEVRKSIRRQN